MIVFCIFSCSFNSSSCICTRINGSKAEKASSIKSTSGSFAIARANPTRCCIPPDNSQTFWFSYPFNPTRATLSTAFWSLSFLGTPCNSKPKAILLNTVRWGSNPKCWKTIAISLRRISNNSLSEEVVMFFPLIKTSPKEGSFNRLIQRNSVDFPLPESPIITNNSPSSIFRFALRTANVQPVSFKMSCLLFPATSILFARIFSGPKRIDKFFISIFVI